jgi:hypothetical protein
VGQKYPGSERSQPNPLIVDNAAFVNRVEDDLMSPRNGFTGSKIFAANVHKVGIFGEWPRKSRAVRGIPRLFQLINDLRNNLLAK